MVHSAVDDALGVGRVESFRHLQRDVGGLPVGHRTAGQATLQVVALGHRHGDEDLVAGQ